MITEDGDMVIIKENCEHAEDVTLIEISFKVKGATTINVINVDKDEGEISNLPVSCFTANFIQLLDLSDPNITSNMDHQVILGEAVSRT